MERGHAVRPEAAIHGVRQPVRLVHDWHFTHAIFRSCGPA